MPLPPIDALQRELLTIIILGATGDLATKKLFPALRGLDAGRFLPRRTRILATGRTHFAEDDFRAHLRDTFTQHGSGLLRNANKWQKADQSASALDSNSQTLNGAFEQAAGESTSDSADLSVFMQRVSYFQLPLGVHVPRASQDGSDISTAVPALVEAIAALESTELDIPHNRLYYLALPEPARLYPDLCCALGERGKSVTGWTKVILEKPFGNDALSCRKLNERLAAHFEEESLFRIDRYLGKEIVENLLVMRFANRLLAPIWNRDNISNVQIIFKEPFGPADQGRGEYFDKAGIVRDVVQSHLLQLLALLAMDRPSSLAPDDIRAGKHKVLRQALPVKLADVVLGQYEGYQQEAGVRAGSRSATFATLVVYINNERWDGVPFILKAGKGLNERKSEIRVQLKDVSGDIFEPGQVSRCGRNELVLRMQPQEEMYLKVVIKEPGRGVVLVPAELELTQRWHLAQARKAATGEAPRRAFERLLLDAIVGDQSTFIRADEMDTSWDVLEGVLRAADAGEVPLLPYKVGGGGPLEAHELRVRAGHTPSVYSSVRDARDAALFSEEGFRPLDRAGSVLDCPAGGSQASSSPRGGVVVVPRKSLAPAGAAEEAE